MSNEVLKAIPIGKLAAGQSVTIELADKSMIELFFNATNQLVVFNKDDSDLYYAGAYLESVEEED